VKEMRRWILTMVAAALAASAGTARAQTLETPRARQGYWVALGGFGAVNQAWREGERLEVASGGAGNLRLGQLLTRRFGVGLVLDGGGTAKGARRAQLGGVAVEAQWELVHHLALRAAVGGSVVALNDLDDPDDGQRATWGSGYSLGLGWDWFPSKSRLTGGLALTPVVQVRFTPGENASAVVGLIGLEIGWWTGLPRNQLELPESDAYRKQ
jgi:hypothetical protein